MTMTVEERLATLEAELAASKRLIYRFIKGASILVVLLVIFATVRYTTDPAYAQENASTVLRAKEIRANRFIVEDDGTNGQQEAIFGMIQDAPGLRLGGEGAPQISLSTHSGTYLYLADEKGSPRILMQVVGDRSSLSMFNENRKDLLDIALTWDKPGLILTDEKGEVLWQTP
jgi:hypothetical protein